MAYVHRAGYFVFILGLSTALFGQKNAKRHSRNTTPNYGEKNWTHMEARGDFLAVVRQEMRNYWRERIGVRHLPYPRKSMGFPLQHDGQTRDTVSDLHHFTCTGKVAGFLEHRIMVHPSNLAQDYAFIVVPDT